MVRRTSEMTEEEKAEQARFIARFKTARAAILEVTGGKRGVSGNVDPCPVCGKGRLRFSVAGLNGHIHAACTTDGCVAWME